MADAEGTEMGSAARQRRVGRRRCTVVQRQGEEESEGRRGRAGPTPRGRWAVQKKGLAG
jgi:hypothetical protein